MKKEFLKWLAFVLAALLLQGIYVYAFFIEPNWIRIEYVKIANPKLSAALSGIKIIQLSDLHIERMGFKEVSLVEKVNKLKPDLILITGDLVEGRDGLNPLLNILSLLEPKLRTYAIFGESDSPLAELKETILWDKAKTYLLEGKAIRLNIKDKENASFWLIGTSSAEEFDRLTSNIPKDEPIILMSHRPDIVKQAAIKEIDLVICGHTHGGQIGIPLLWRFFSYAERSKYMAGLYKVRNTLLYVNRGLASKKGMRLLCWPEITVFDFVSGTKGKSPKILKQDR